MAMSSKVNQFKIALIGTGNVGRTLIQQIIDSRSFHLRKYGFSYDIVALTDSQGALAIPSNTTQTDNQIIEILKEKANGKNFNSNHPWFIPNDRLSSVYGPQTILVDCSSSSKSTDLLLNNLRAGGAVALANKQPLTQAQSIWDEFFSTQNFSRVGYESTVGAGTPFIRVTRALVSSNDSVKKMEGTFSGTLGFVSSGLEKGDSYSSVVSEAAKLGYTEPDPRDDLGGVDVARKALILARSLDLKIEMNQVSIEALYPSTLSSLTVPEFMKALPSLDEQFRNRIEQEKLKGCVLRYAARIEPSSDNPINVAFTSVPKNSPLGSLTGTENLLSITSATYSSSPLVVRGAGAGGEVTARGLLADIVQLSQVLKPL